MGKKALDDMKNLPYSLILEGKRVAKYQVLVGEKGEALIITAFKSSGLEKLYSKEGLLEKLYEKMIEIESLLLSEKNPYLPKA